MPLSSGEDDSSGAEVSPDVPGYGFRDCDMILWQRRVRPLSMAGVQEHRQAAADISNAAAAAVFNLNISRTSCKICVYKNQKNIILSISYYNR